MLAFISFALSGCLGLGKSSDAVSPTSPSLTQFAATIEKQSSLARSSGQATLARLTALFPLERNALNPMDFGFQGAKGLNQVFGQETRPYDSLAQVALRGKVATLCKGSLNKLFELGVDSRLSGESDPADPIEQMVLAAVRNAWLHPYKVEDAEVRQLVSLYHQSKSSADGEGGETGAKRAVCMSVLLAPQFWMGTPFPTDPARRISLEFFQRVPKMQELADFAAGKFTSTEYFDRLYADATLRQGFVNTVNEWHHEWLGLREFIPGSARNRDPRPHQLSSNMTGASHKMGLFFSTQTLTTGNTTVLQPSADGLVASSCTSESTTQEFDPDTAMTAWEHFNYDLGGFDFIGGWVRASIPAGVTTLSETDTTVVRGAIVMKQLGVATIADRISALGLMPFATPAIRQTAVRDVCGRTLSTHTTRDQEGINWRRCNGLVRINPAAAARISTALGGILSFARLYHAYSLSTAGQYPMDMRCPTVSAGGADPTGCVANFQTAYRNDRNAKLDAIQQLAMRIKSYSSTAIVQNTELHAAILAQYPVLGNASQREAFFNAYVGGAVGGGNLGSIDTMIASFGTAVASAPSNASIWHYETDIANVVTPVGIGTQPTLKLPYYSYNNNSLERFAPTLGGQPTNTYTPLLDLTNLVNGRSGFAQSSRRVQRLGGQSLAWQNGYSRVKLWWTGGEIPVCNNADRLWASCFYRPSAVAIGSARTPEFSPVKPIFFQDFLPDSAMHPALASAFYCGVPASGTITRAADALGNAAYLPIKFGASGSLNTVATNISLQSPVATGPVATEVAVYNEVSTQLANEPYELIEDLLVNKKDYRELLTANYTHGNSCFKFFYDTQGYALPAHAGAAGEACKGPGADTRATIVPGPAIPIGHLSSASGEFQGGGDARNAMWAALHGGAPAALPPRTYSGILTMPAFVVPVATTTRGIVARYFARLLCDQPTFYDPSLDKEHAGATDLHASFVSRRKHLKQECFQCHRNLDPISSAVSWTYLGLLRPDPNDPGYFINGAGRGGEGGLHDYLGELDAVEADGPLVGLRNGGVDPAQLSGAGNGAGQPGRGSFMGKPVKGIRELASAMADSDKFAGCVTQTVFSRVFGRPVQFADAPFYKQLVNDFKDPRKANYRYLELLRLMIGSEAFTRKN